MAQYLPCYDWVVKEANRYGSKWTKRWAQEKAITTITSYLAGILAEHAQAADTALYPQWEDFLRDFLQMGGIIEAVPPSDSITPIAVDILIEPTGQVKVLCTLDQVSASCVAVSDRLPDMTNQICSQQYKVWGGSVPQSSVPHDKLMEEVDKVAAACKARGILGHLCIDFLTFIDPVSVSIASIMVGIKLVHFPQMQQVLWCVDLDLTYSNTLALYRLMHYLTGFELDAASGTLMSSRKTEMCVPYAILSPHLYHTNLSPLYHSIFFQMCKAHFIGYDPNVSTTTPVSMLQNLKSICR